MLGSRRALGGAAGLALTFILLALGRFGASLRWWALLPLLAALAVIAVTDLTMRRIPDWITLPGIVYGLVLTTTLPDAPSLWQAGLGVAVGGGAVLLLAIVSGGSVGGGDIKLTAMLGSALGWQGALLAFAGSQVLGAIVALGLLAAGRRGLRDHLPVGSFIAVLGALLLIGTA